MKVLPDGGLELGIDDDDELVVGLPVPRPHLLTFAFAPAVLGLLELLLLLDFLQLSAPPHQVQHRPLLLTRDGQSPLREYAPSLFPPDGHELQFPASFEVVLWLLLHGNYK